MNETTRTAAAAQPNSHSGIGTSARWTMPCADARAGRDEPGREDRAGGRGREAAAPHGSTVMLRELGAGVVQLQLEDALDVRLRTGSAPSCPAPTSFSMS